MCFIFIYVFRVPISNNAIERNLDIDLVHKVLEKNYVVYVPASNDETHERDVTKREDLWEILGVNKPSQESVTSSQLEMEQFMRFPLAVAQTDIDPLQWWFNNMFASHFSIINLTFFIKFVQNQFQNVCLHLNQVCFTSNVQDGV